MKLVSGGDYEALSEDKECKEEGCWHVWDFDPKEGDFFGATFSGQGAEQRAKEYAAWMNSR